jgi:hypothetical protein
MLIPRPKKLVVLGLMSRMPVAGVVWQTAQYLVGFERLGFDVYYVEAHGCVPRDFMRNAEDDASARAATFLEGTLRRFGFSGRWAFHALHDDGRCFGMSRPDLERLYAEAELIINLHGGTLPLPEHSATGRLVYVESDPVEVQIELYHQVQAAIDYLRPHCALFTFGENYGRPDCRLPVCEAFRFRPTRQPVVLDFWETADRPRPAFTTIGNWRQMHRELEFQGDVYHWSKHLEFLKFLELPRRTAQPFELALASCEADDRALLHAHGWRVRPAGEISYDLDAYRAYVATSRAEFTVAKDQNVRLRSGWFSDRSATYLAAGRPVVTQETGFSNFLPTGRGLFAFSTLDQILAAVDAINTDYPAHCQAAREIAREYFSYDKVLGRMLDELGVTAVGRSP